MIKKFPEYKTQLDNPYIVQSTDALNKLPNFIKDAYGKSITGIAEEMSTGKKRFDLSGYEPSVLEDIGAELASFIMPYDLLTTVAGGGIGGAAVKVTATKYLTKKFVQNGVKGSVARTIAAKQASNVGKATVGLASYEGLKSGVTQKFETGDIQPEKVVKDAMSGALLGGSTAGTGAYLSTKGYSTITKVLAETGVLGTTIPLSEGNLPNPQDYINAAGMIMGLKSVGGALHSPRLLKELYDKGRTGVKKARGTGFTTELVDEQLAREFGVDEGKLSNIARRQTETYVDAKGNKWNIIRPENRKKIKIVNYNTGESKVIKDTDFSLQYRLEDEVQVNNEFENKKLLITGHINPDGDALGSALAYKIILNELGIDSDVCFDIKETLPSNLNHLPYDLINEVAAAQYDRVFVFDCGNPSRLGKYEDLILEASNIIVIDHHIDPTFGSLQIVDSEAASTTQVLYRQLIDEGYIIDKSMANCLASVRFGRTSGAHH